jgi:hypothetical protein
MKIRIKDMGYLKQARLTPLMRFSVSISDGKIIKLLKGVDNSYFFIY